jgi:hypothetical protein
MLYFLEVNSTDSGAALAVIMAINSLLENSMWRKEAHSTFYIIYLLQRRVRANPSCEYVSQASAEICTTTNKQRGYSGRMYGSTKLSLTKGSQASTADEVREAMYAALLSVCPSDGRRE